MSVEFLVTLSVSNFPVVSISAFSCNYFSLHSYYYSILITNPFFITSFLYLFSYFSTLTLSVFTCLWIGLSCYQSPSPCILRHKNSGVLSVNPLLCCHSLLTWGWSLPSVALAGPPELLFCATNSFPTRRGTLYFANITSRLASPGPLDESNGVDVWGIYFFWGGVVPQWMKWCGQL